MALIDWDGLTTYDSVDDVRHAGYSGSCQGFSTNPNKLSFSGD